MRSRRRKVSRAWWGVLLVRWPRSVLLACALASAAAGADPLTDGLNQMLSQRGCDGAFGAAAQENTVVVTSEALLALRALGMGGSTEAQEAERFLASATRDVDYEAALRRQRALAGTVLLPPFIAYTGHAPAFDADDAAVLAHTLLVLVVRTS